MDDVQLFLVHVWPRNPGFRALARRADSDEQQLLHSPQELAAYLDLASGTAQGLVTHPISVPPSSAETVPQHALGGPDDPPG